MADTCPTCGSPVEVISSDEGTQHYRPARPRVCDTWDCAGVPVAEFRWHEGHVGMQISNYCESCLTALENGGWDGTTVRYPARVDPADVEALRRVVEADEQGRDARTGGVTLTRDEAEALRRVLGAVEGSAVAC